MVGLDDIMDFFQPKWFYESGASKHFVEVLMQELNILIISIVAPTIPNH